MTRNKNVDRVLERARKAKSRLTPVAARVKPLAGRTRAAARRGVHKGRAWAAPQVKRAGETLKDDVAPKVSAMMSSAAERIDPDKHRRSRVRKAAGAATATAAASAATAFLRKRLRHAHAQSADQPAGEQSPNGQAGADAGSEGDTDARLRAS